MYRWKIVYWSTPAINKVTKARTMLNMENPCKFGQYATTAPIITEISSVTALYMSISSIKKSTPPKNSFLSFFQVTKRITPRQKALTRISTHTFPPNHQRDTSTPQNTHTESR